MGTLALRLLFDEDTERDLATELRATGHDVERSIDVDDLGPGASDSVSARHVADPCRLIRPLLDERNIWIPLQR